jgi:hypothetical protein
MARAERFSVSTDAAGRFAWRGDGAWTQAHLDLRRENGDRLLLPTRTVTLGTAEALALEIEIAETSGLRGSVLRDELAFETRLCVHAMNAEGRIWRHFLFSRDDEFELELRPGTYRCWLEASGFELFYRKEVEAGVLAVVEASEVIVREGEMARDPRLQAIDLRGRFRKLRGVLLDASGEPVRRQRFRLAPLVAGVLLGAYQVETDRDGRFAATCLREHTSFLLSFGGFRPIELAWQPEEQVVRCAEGIRVQLELAADAPALPPGFELEACLSPLGFPSTDLASAIGVGADFCSVVRDGRCELRVPIAGSYRVEWSLSFHTQGTWANSGRGENVVEIRDLGEPVRLVVAPAADAIERARRLLVEKR